MREIVAELYKLGKFPSSANADIQQLEVRENTLNSIFPPLADDEAKALINLFGPDDYYGLAWTLVHLIESAPSWPMHDCLKEDSNPWISVLKQRVANSPKKTHS
jgi:hypothetical protein